MFLSGCKECSVLAAVTKCSQRRQRRSTTKFTTSWIVTTFITFLFIGTLSSGEKVTTRAKGIVTTKDILSENDNFRTRRQLSTTNDAIYNVVKKETKKNGRFVDENNILPSYNDVLLNSHRKSLFARAQNPNVVEIFQGTKNKLLGDNQTAAEDKTIFSSNNNNNIDDDEEKADIEFSSSWAVRLPKHLHTNGMKHSTDIAKDLGLTNNGNIGHLDGHFLLVHHSFYKHTPKVNESLRIFRDAVTRSLQNHPHIEWVQHEVVLKRKKRSLEFKDEFFPSQWHLDNLKFVGHDINVTGVWEHNITGKGVTVSVIDDGVEWTNPDIYENYSPEGSWDLNSNDADPMPRVDDAGLNHHGTRCAGEIAAVANEFCAVGVAFGARVSGIRILDGPMTDSLEAMAFNTKSNVNDVYSCSWGPDDNGRTVDGPHRMAQAALAHGVMAGRRGFGSIFVVASGNGGHFKDNCNFDGYANSIFTVTIGAVDELGQMPYYAEQCAAMLAVTYSSGQGHQRNIVTTDWRLGSGTGCTDRHTGTSAAAPLAAGIIALMLQARPCLTWRDVQHIIVYTAVRVDIDPQEWQVNGAGLAHSHKHGFGLLDSWRLVTTSKMWTDVPFMTSWSSDVVKTNDRIPILPGFNLSKTMHVTKEMAEQVVTLEHVTITVSIKHPKRGALTVKLISPSQTISKLASLRKYDKSKEGFNDWTFSTVKCWGEKPQGVWKLVITDEGDGNHEEGVLTSWRITFYGSLMTPHDLQERRKLVKKASSGRYLHKPGVPCPAPPVMEEKEDLISPKVLKIILLLSGFLFLVGLYFVLETFCDHHSGKELSVKEGVNINNKGDLETHGRGTLAENTETQCTIDITSPEDFSMLDSFISDKLTKDDEERLTNIIEHGSSRPTAPSLSSFSMTDTASLEILNITNPVSTPDESIRVKEFEDRMKYAMEQSLKLQLLQISQLDNLQKECEQIFDPNTIDMFSMNDPAAAAKTKKRKKKLKGILKKPQQYKE